MLFTKQVLILKRIYELCIILKSLIFTILNPIIKHTIDSLQINKKLQSSPLRQFFYAAIMDLAKYGLALIFRVLSVIHGKMDKH